MARVLLILLFLMVIVVFAAILVSFWKAAYRHGPAAMRSFTGTSEASLMAPTALQKVAYLALILLLLGISTGWIGGM
ncbi:hypothetical protein ACFSUD_05875 [Sulfitobacter aestuarii]|uniref:HIG1 domain-containing protein n=1 Tax=Sulfitobacter aestuarii TaxID=2161676 RepID=A0ABW5U0U5_9RHOB